MKLLIATHNPGKLKRYQRLLQDIPNLKLISLSDLDITEKVDEPFDNARDNAEHKARRYAEISGLPTLAVDESMQTNFLPDNEQPGVYVRRHLKTDREVTDEEMLKYWKKIFADYPQEDKMFIWDFAIAYFDPRTGSFGSSQAIQKNRIATVFSKKINPGYPMSSFLIGHGLETDKPYTEMTPEESAGCEQAVFGNFVKDFSVWWRKIA